MGQNRDRLKHIILNSMLGGYAFIVAVSLQLRQNIIIIKQMMIWFAVTND